jgi:hypothetical protein
MDALSRFFVQQPLHILAVAAIHFLLWAARRGRIRAIRHAGAILVSSFAWLAYSA